MRSERRRAKLGNANSGQGFALGMDDSRSIVARSAAGMLGAPGFVRGSGGGGTTIHQTIQIKIDGAQAPHDVGKAVVDAVALAFGQVRQMQVGM